MLVLLMTWLSLWVQVEVRCSSQSSKQLQQIIRLKRLLQMKEGGGSYNSFVQEQRRYHQESNVTEEVTERMRKVYQYKKEQAEKALSSVYSDVGLAPDIHFLTQEDFKFPNENRVLEQLIDGLNASSQLVSLHIPNVQNANTKRFEAQWLTYLKDTLRLSEAEVVVAYSSNADALLRFAESYPLLSVVLIDPCSLYTLGERHGRDYRYSWIDRNVKRVVVVSTSNETREDAATVFSNLGCEKRLFTLDHVAEMNGIWVELFVRPKTSRVMIADDGFAELGC